MKKHFFRRTFAIYFLVLLVSIIFIERYATNIVRTTYINELKESLTVQAILIADNIPLQQKDELDNLCRRFHQMTGARVSVISPEGTVIGDSHIESPVIGNHADKPEIKQAAIDGTGYSLRFSNTSRLDLLYTARKIERDGKLSAFIRLALPLEDINKSINALRIKINLAVILLLLMSGALLTWQTDRIRIYVSKVSDYAGALSHGLFRKRLYLKGAGEFSELAESLNEMAGELESTIKERNEKTNRLSVVLKSIPDALLLINTSNIIELSNNAARELFGNIHLEGQSYIEIVKSPDFASLINTVKQDRMPGSVDIVLNFPKEHYLSVRVSPLSYQVGELSGFIAIFHDTTQIKKLEKMRKDFVANVSHELKTPVTSIKGFAETLLDGALADKEHAEQFLRTISSQSDRLNRLVEDLLTLSRIEMGVIKINKKTLKLKDLIDRALKTFVVQADKKNFHLRNSIINENITINADPDRLEQILLNLLDNAIKFTESGVIEAGADHEGEHKYFYIKDTGSGIPEEYLSRVGERFFRVDPSRSRELGGTGLGLAIVKHIVLAHQWQMKVESKVGRGTIVKIFYL